MVLAAMRNGPSVNGPAIWQLLFFYHNILDVVCFSHTIDNVGSHFDFSILNLFFQYWVSFLLIVSMRSYFGGRELESQ